MLKTVVIPAPRIAKDQRKVMSNPKLIIRRLLDQRTVFLQNALNNIDVLLEFLDTWIDVWDDDDVKGHLADSDISDIPEDEEQRRARLKRVFINPLVSYPKLSTNDAYVVTIFFMTIVLGALNELGDGVVRLSDGSIDLVLMENPQAEEIIWNDSYQLVTTPEFREPMSYFLAVDDGNEGSPSLLLDSMRLLNVVGIFDEPFEVIPTD